MNVQEQKCRRETVRICHQIYRQGFVAATDGNISARIKKDRILTTPTGVSKGSVTEDDLVITDLEGNRISGKREPSSEIRIHLCVYNMRPDVKAVIHAHPPISTAFSIAGVSIAQCILPEVILTLGSIPTTRYATPTTEEGPEVVTEYIGNYDAMILDHHGSLTVGRNLEEAYLRLEKVEHAAEITLYARQLGPVRQLDRQQVDRLLSMRKEMGKKLPDFRHCGLCVNRRDKEQNPDAFQVDEEKIVTEIVTAISKISNPN
ncbi:MAG: class II aldolase/adducin family protein [bacterium]